MPEPLSPLLKRRVLVGAAEETTSGTPVAVANAISAVITGANCSPDDFFADGLRAPDGLYGGELPAFRGKTTGKLSFRMEVAYGSGFLPMLTAAGFKAAVGVYAYTSDFAKRKTWTYVIREDGRLKKLYGAAWTSCKLEIKRAGRIMADVDVAGTWMDVIDNAIFAQPTFPTLPYTSRGATLTIDSGGGAVAIPAPETITIDFGLTTEERGSFTADSGMAHMLVVNSVPRIEMDCQARTVADRDVFNDLLNGTASAFSLALVTLTGGHTLTIAAPVIQRRAVGNGERNGMLVDPETFVCCVDNTAGAGDNALTLVEA